MPSFSAVYIKSMRWCFLLQHMIIKSKYLYSTAMPLPFMIHLSYFLLSALQFVMQYASMSVTCMIQLLIIRAKKMWKKCVILCHCPIPASVTMSSNKVSDFCIFLKCLHNINLDTLSLHFSTLNWKNNVFSAHKVSSTNITANIIYQGFFH